MLRRSLLRTSQAAFKQSRCDVKPHAPARSIIQSHKASIPPRLYPRFYSTATEATSEASTSQGQAGTATGSTDGKTQSPEKAAEDALKKDIEVKDREIIDLKDKYLRSVADFRNLQERTKRDIDSARNFAISRFAADLIDSVDNLDRALSTVPQDKVSDPSSSSASSTSNSSSSATSGEGDASNKDLRNLYSGLKMTDTILMQTLKKHGLERFDPAEKGDVFNPNLHDATFQAKVEGKEDGTVFLTQQKGFILNGRVVRAAKVGVVKNS